MSNTPEQEIKHMILALTARWDGVQLPEIMEGVEIDRRYQELVDQGGHWDARNEVRASGIETGLPCDFSRHYDSDAVAAKSPSGKWVGWTYWHGGGKHGEPDGIPWMQNAYFVDCVEKQEMVTTRTFTAPPPAE